jgi:branched-chain amino acid transport system substrate-binding protein
MILRQGGLERLPANTETRPVINGEYRIMKALWLSGAVLAAGLAFAGSAQAADLAIGVAGPLTGPNAAFGAQLQNGAQMAADDINAAGGVLGMNIVLSFGDDQSKPEQGVSVANKFVGDGVHYVDGHFNSGVSIPASEVYSENGVLQITPASTNPVFTERGLWNTFRTCGRDDQQGAVAGAYIAAHYAGQGGRDPSRQDPLRPGPRRRDQEGDERRRPERGLL